MKRFILSAFCWLQIAPAAMAMRDANLNGLSDIWEKLFNNGNLFPASFNPLADPDGDGWTNLQEATVGTDPFNSQAPEGFLAPAIMIFRPDPGGNPSALPIYRLTWPTFEGKAYQVFISTDLQPASWIAASEAILGRGIALTYDAEALHSNGTSPPALFWRIQVADTNSDSDNLNDWEEGRLGTLPDHPDTDRDGIPDHLDVAPFDSAVLADPDGLNLPPGALANLVGWWDMQPQPSSNSPLTIASRASDLSGAKHPLNQQYGLPNPYSFAGKGIMTPPAAPAAINLLALGSNSSLRGKSSFTIHYWLRLKKDRLAVTGSFFIPPEVTLASYGSVGTQPPNIEWSAIRSPSGGTRFLLDDGNRPNSTKWFTPGAHDSPVPIDDNRWHHLALVIGGNNTRMFLDGKKIGPTSGNLVSFGIPSTIYQNNGYLIVGGTKKLPASGSGNANPISDLIGEVDSIMLNSRVLDSADPLIFEKIHHRDRDSDGLWDITEVSSELWRDQNSNGVLTATELTYRSNPNQWQDPLTSDVDGDGLTDVREQNETNTSIWNPDTDGDLLPDGWEVDNGLNPNNQTGVHGAAGDREPDGVSNLDEYRNGSDPNLGDTDGDRTSDSDEINGPDGDPNTDDGSNPNDPSDNGRQLPPEERITIKLGIGDQSGSESEDYVMNVFHIVPDTGRERRIHTLRSGGFGKFKEQTLSIFRRGETYTFQIDWQNTNNKDKPASGGNPPDGPDYDYTFKVEPQGDFPGLLLDSYDPKTKSIDQSKPLLAEGADNVAESQQEFEQNFEGRRVILLPVEVTAAFGEGPDVPEGSDQSSRELLEEYLGGIKVARQGDVWAVNGKDAQGNDKIWGVEIVSDQAKLNTALSSGEHYVVFDGHSNFGFGPDFLGSDQILRINDFTNFGAQYTDVPLTFRKLIRNPQNPNDPSNFGDPYGNLVIPDQEIAGAPTNYKPLPINEERFPNIDGVGVGQAFQKQGQGFDTFHYRIQGGGKRLMIDAPKTDLPANLAYKTFFYNACDTGNDYIENFKQGDFIYTNKSCFVHQGTKIFVQGVIEGKTTAQIMPLLNQQGVGNNVPNDIIYEFENF